MTMRHLTICAAAALAMAAWATPAPANMPRALAHSGVRYTARTPSNARRGRPRKFGRPSRAVTLTLPHDIIAALREIDADLSRAVVNAVQASPSGSAPRAELATFGPNAVIIVPNSQTLREYTGVELVPISDGRALVSFDGHTSIPHLELRVMDALADPALAGHDRAMFEQLAQVLRSARHAGGLSVEHRSIVVMRQHGGADGNGSPETTARLKAV
jgi:hypothetical protein